MVANLMFLNIAKVRFSEGASVSVAVADAPGRLMGELAVAISSFRTKFKTRSFASTQHNSRISLMCRRVVKSLPAMRSMVR
ncbi:MAG: hypothetical protein Q7V40_09070 [Pseudolabrys sp.]|nr:hypothetical protein [Pseudolabrys sp.]